MEMREKRTHNTRRTVPTPKRVPHHDARWAGATTMSVLARAESVIIHAVAAVTALYLSVGIYDTIVSRDAPASPSSRTTTVTFRDGTTATFPRSVVVDSFDDYPGWGGE